MLDIMKKFLHGKIFLCAAFAPVCMMIEVLMDLQQPTFMSHIIDEGVGKGDVHYILHTGGIMIICAFVGMLGGIGCSILSNYAGTFAGKNIRKELFYKIQSLSFTQIDQLKPSSLITRLTNDVMQIQTMITMLLKSMVRAPLLCIGAILMSFSLSPKLSLIFCVVLPILICIAIYIVKKTIPMYTTVQDCIDRMNIVMRENLLGIRVIKTFRLEKNQSTRFIKANEQLKNSNIYAQKKTFLLMPIVTLMMNISVIAVLWFGGLMSVANELQAGKIMAFINYMVQITNALLMMVNFAVNISRAQASSKRIKEVMSLSENMKDNNIKYIPSTSDIIFDHVSFRYAQKEYALSNVSFQIKQGEMIGIIGATGSGKSTLAYLLERFYDPQNGVIRIGGVDIKDISITTLREKISLIMQDSILFSGTIKRNLLFGNPQASLHEIHQALGIAKAEDFIVNDTQGLKRKVEQRGKNFSGGQKQRLNIARTLLKNPDILIIDDATSALDLSTEAQLLENIEKIYAEKTKILIAQRVASLLKCDQIFVLDQGKLIAKGTHHELLHSCEIYRSIAISQLGKEVLSYE